jgi:hypothetical protein
LWTQIFRKAYLCLRYGLMIWSSLLLLKCLGNLFKNLEKNLLQSSSLICQVLPKSYDDISWKPFTHMLLVFALSFIKLLWPLREFFSCFHDQDSRALHLPPCYTSKRS